MQSRGQMRVRAGGGNHGDPVADDATDPDSVRRRTGHHNHRLHAVGWAGPARQRAGVVNTDRAGTGAHEVQGHRSRRAAQVGQGDRAAGSIQEARVGGESVLSLDGHDDLGLLLAACCERVVRTLLGTLGPAGYGHLTSTQAITLLFIGRGIDTVTQLAERTGLTSQAMSKICAALQADGLLDRQPHTDDARSRRLALTVDGRRLQNLLDQAGAQAERAWANLVGTQTLQTVRAALAAYAHSPEPATPTTQVRLRFT
jgi:DNA-binding MarR family transcriptional regulator